MPFPWRNWYHCMASTFGHWLPGDPQGFRTRHHREHIEGDYKNPPPPGKHDGRLAHSRRIMKRPPVLLPPEARLEACKRLVEALHHYDVQVIDLCMTATHFHVLARFSSFDESLPNPPTGVGGLSVSDDHTIIVPEVDWNILKQQIESAPGYFTDDDGDAEPEPDNSTLQSPPTPVGGSPGSPGAPALTQNQNPPTGVGGLSPEHHRKDGLDPRPRYLIGKAKSWCSRQVKTAGLMTCQGGLFAKRGKIVPVADRRHQIQIARYIRKHVREGGVVHSLIGT